MYFYNYHNLYPFYGYAPYHNYYGQYNKMNNFYGNERQITPIVTDQGPRPFVVDIEEATKRNNTFRTALWTGKHLQVTLMSIPPGEDIGLEIHPTTDQFLRVEEGRGIVQMGRRRNQLDYVRRIEDDSAIMVPAGVWHNVRNTGRTPLKLYSIYAPPEHPHGTVHSTKQQALAAEAKNYQRLLNGEKMSKLNENDQIDHMFNN